MRRDTGYRKEGVNMAADDWVKNFRPGDQFWRDVPVMFGMGMIDSHETLMQYWSSTGALDKQLLVFTGFFPPLNSTTH